MLHGMGKFKYLYTQNVISIVKTKLQRSDDDNVRYGMDGNQGLFGRI